MTRHTNSRSQKRDKRRNRTILLIILGVILVSFGSLLVIQSVQNQRQWHTEAAVQEPVDHEDGTVTYEEQTYVPKKNLQTFLVMGLDKFEASPQEMGYLNDQQADFLLLMILDPQSGRCQMLHINRDTMAQIQRLGVGGGAAGSFMGQLALAHTYGSGGSDSCLNTVKAVSNLLDGVPIDHYVSLSMEAVALFNDMVGGVTVYVADDFSQVDPTLVRGEEICLHGDQALHFVRTRGGMEDSSNLSRMKRQRQYMDGFYEALMSCLRVEPDFTNQHAMEIAEHVQTDLSVAMLQDLMEGLEDYVLAPVEVLEGEAVVGKEYMEYYVEEQTIHEMVLHLFYEEA